MANAYVQQRIHLVWSTGGRKPVLSDQILEQLPRIMGGMIRRRTGVLFALGGVADHIHVYTEYPKTMPLSAFVNAIKSCSSGWIRRQPGMQGFTWQTGYAAFTVSPDGDQCLQNYIENQAEHHRKSSFESEYIRLLRKAGISFDPKYLFDQARP